MDNNGLFEYIKNAPNEIKNALIGVLINASVGMSKVENNLLKNNDESGNTGDKLQINNIKSNLLASMQRGEMNEQYVQYYYQVLEKAEDFMMNSSKMDIKQALERNGMLLTEDGNNKDIHKFLNSNDNYNRVEHKVSNNIEVTIKNNVYLIDQFETNRNSNSYGSTIKCTINTPVTYKIELYTETLKAAITSNNNRMLYFYIPLKYPINQLISDFKQIKDVMFTTNVGKKYFYNIKSFDSIKEESNYYIISFNAYVIQNLYK